MIRIKLVAITEKTNGYLLDALYVKDGVVSDLMFTVPDLEMNTVFDGVKTALENHDRYVARLTELNKALQEFTV